MKILIYIFVIFLLVSCQESNPDGNKKVETRSITLPDTIIGSKPITDEIAGSAYRKRATGYFVIVDNDTSEFMPIFTESNENGSVGLDLNLPYLNDVLSFSDKMHELKMILPKAAKEYNLDSLAGISIGRLIQTGDLALEVSEQYRKQFGEPTTIQTKDYETVALFLKESSLGGKFNSLFQPYSLKVDQVWVEKVFFTTKDELLHFKIKIDKEPSEIPDKILDCLAGIKLKKE